MGIGMVTLVKNGFGTTESPSWVTGKAGAFLVFSDTTADKQWKLVPPSTITEYRVAPANGTAVAPDGSLVVCENGRLARIKDPEAAPPAAEEVAPFTQLGAGVNPNDVVVRKDGTIYATVRRLMPAMFNGAGAVFRVPPGGKAIVETARETVDGARKLLNPNGIALSPDDKILYVVDSSYSAGAGQGVWRFDLAADGTVSGGKFLAAVSAPDGMAVDDGGNLYVTSSQVVVLKPDGTRWGTIQTPGQPRNCTFGGADRKTLYITGGQNLWSVTMPVSGLP
jgi:gluconolactonase